MIVDELAQDAICTLESAAEVLRQRPLSLADVARARRQLHESLGILHELEPHLGLLDELRDQIARAHAAWMRRT